MLNATPLLLPLGDAMAVLMPMTSPSKLTSGPPLEPGVLAVRGARRFARLHVDDRRGHPPGDALEAIADLDEVAGQGRAGRRRRLRGDSRLQPREDAHGDSAAKEGTTPKERNEKGSFH